MSTPIGSTSGGPGRRAGGTCAGRRRLRALAGADRLGPPPRAPRPSPLTPAAVAAPPRRPLGGLVPAESQGRGERPGGARACMPRAWSCVRVRALAAACRRPRPQRTPSRARRRRAPARPAPSAPPRGTSACGTCLGDFGAQAQGPGAVRPLRRAQGVPFPHPGPPLGAHVARRRQQQPPVTFSPPVRPCAHAGAGPGAGAIERGSSEAKE